MGLAIGLLHAKLSYERSVFDFGITKTYRIKPVEYGDTEAHGSLIWKMKSFRSANQYRKVTTLERSGFMVLYGSTQC